MKAALLENWQKMEVKDISKPEIEEGEALIKMKYAGVCGSDITVYTGSHPTATVPIVIGHEILGTIEEIKGNSDFKIGDRVTVEPLISCGECDACKGGYGHVCRSLKLLGIHENGGYAEYVKVSNKKLVKVPEQLSDELAALSEPFAVGYHVCTRSGIKKGETALVIGGGPIGIVVALSAQFFGAKVVISEVNEKRLTVAKSLGIDTINPSKSDVKEKICELTSGVGADVVYEASGSKAGILTTTDVVKIRGVIVPMSLSGKTVEFCLGKVSFKELSVKGSRVYTFEHFKKGVAMLGEIAKKTDLTPLISNILPLKESEKAIKMMLSGENAGKILIKCN